MAQHIVQVRLPDQHDLEQLGLVGFEVRQQTDLFEDTRIEMLRLVDHDDGMRVQRNQRREKLLERGDELMPRDLRQWLALPRVGRGHEAKIDQDPVEQIADAQSRIENHRQKRSCFVERFQQRPAQHRLAGADLAGDDDQPFTPAQRRRDLLQRP